TQAAGLFSTVEGGLVAWVVFAAIMASILALADGTQITNSLNHESTTSPPLSIELCARRGIDMSRAFRSGEAAAYSTARRSTLLWGKFTIARGIAIADQRRRLWRSTAHDPVWKKAPVI